MKKKKLVFVFLLIVLFKPGLTAQDNPSQFSYGLQIGAGFSGFTHNMDIFSEFKSGFAGGIFGEYKPIPLLGISLDVDYVMEGAFHVSPYLIYTQSSVYYPGGSIYKSASDITIHDIHVPLLINIRPIPGGVNPVISLGYSFDYYLTAISRDMIMTSGTQIIALSNRTKENVSSSFQKWNMGPVAGIGINFPGNKFDLGFNLRYKVGLRDINNLGGLNYLNGQYDFSMNTLMFFVSISMK